ncbi:MAG TPA: hypothetical protein VFR90_02760 [Methylibium sp.]|uniref:hypothetical protein n=1 Tax=Methylibium sp. TaxID=2067992 RepID=UPI002DB5CB75|nr:hypothetical protein [Methylibium sp.]HEU4458024.1 hypothetical protein [Methylibium sp.]
MTLPPALLLRSLLRHGARRLVLLAVIASLPLVALEAGLGGVLGVARHVHAPAGAAALDEARLMAGWQDARRIVPGDRRAASLHAGEDPEHDHGAGPHRHAGDDAGVIALDDGEAATGSGAAGALAVDAVVGVHPGAAEAARRWPATAVAGFASRSLPAIERPPRA